MPVLSRTKIEHLGGATLDALVVGESFSGRIIIKVTKDILFSYSTSDGSASTEEGASGSRCYRIGRQAHTLRWKARIHTRTEKTVRSLVKRVTNAVAEKVETAGAVVTAAGGAIATVGGAMDAGIITAPAGVPVTAIGGIVAGIGGVLWGGGAFVKWLTQDETTVTESDSDESGERPFESVTVQEIECLPGHTYSAISVPAPKSPAEAENEAVVEVLRSLGF